MFTRNVAVTGFTFGLVNKTDGSAVTGGTPVEKITKDGGAQADMANAAVHEGLGQWSIDITSTEMDADVVGLYFTHTDAIPVQVTIKTTSLGTLDVNVIQVSGDASAADNLEAAFENAGSNTVTMRLASLSIINSGGDALIAQSTGGNGRGAFFQGNGTGQGLRVFGGASTVAAIFSGANGGGGQVHIGDTSHGIQAQGVGAGDGINAAGGVSAGAHGIHAQSISTGVGGGHGIFAEGSRGGSGFFGSGGLGGGVDTGHGAFFKGGVAGGQGMRTEANFLGEDGYRSVGLGNGAGGQWIGGASNGPGARFTAGGGNAAGAIFQALGVESGVRMVGGVADGHGLSLEGQGVGRALRALAPGAEPLSQNIEDQLAGAPWDINLATHQTAGTAGLYLTQAAKILRNRMKIDAVAFTMTIYDDDELTPYLVWNVKDSAGAPSVGPIFERDPV